jgi:hypothetical protein
LADVKSADEDFIRETNQIFRPRRAGGSIFFDTNRPQIKEITDKFEPIAKEAGASQQKNPAFEEKFTRITPHAEGKGTATELEEKLNQVFRVFKPKGGTADAQTENRSDEMFKPSIDKKDADSDAAQKQPTAPEGKNPGSADAELEERINKIFEPIESKPAKIQTIPEQKAVKQKKSDAGKSRRRGIGSLIPIFSTGENAATAQKTGSDKLVFTLVAILVAAAIITGALSTRGVVDLSAYSNWIHDVFGTVFGG